MDYQDSHDGLAPDEIADALCSDRTWLQSGEHYCAYFGHIDALTKELAKLRELPVDDDSKQRLADFVARCRDVGVEKLVFPATLQDAKNGLLSLEKRFVVIPPPPRPLALFALCLDH